MGNIIETQNITVTPASVTREYNSNTQGHFCASEHTYKNGTVATESELASQLLVNADRQVCINGSKSTDIKGNRSTVVSGLSENITNSSYTIVGNEEMYYMKYQELADEKQTKVAAARSQPDISPNRSLLSTMTDLMKPAPGLLDCLVIPKTDELQKTASMANEFTPSISKAAGIGGFGGSIIDEIENFVVTWGSIIGNISMESASQMASIQGNYMKDRAKKNFEATKEMYNNLSPTMQEAYKQNMGSAIFGNNVERLNSMMPDEVANNSMMFVSPATPKSGDKFWDKNKNEEISMTTLREVAEIERRC